MRFFILAPDTGLPAMDREIAAISAHHIILPQPPLAGYVTNEDLIHEASKEDNQCDVFLVAAHAGANGVQVSDGYLAAEDLANAANDLGASLCVLNACDSDSFAYKVFYLTQVTVIYCRVQIDDEAAAGWSSRLARLLADTDDYELAFRRTGDLGGKYRILSRMNQSQPGQVQGLSVEIQRLSITLAANNDLQTERNKLLQMQIDTLRMEVTELRRVIDMLESAGQSFRSIQPAMAIPPHVIIVIYLSAISLIVGVIFLILRGS